MRDQDERDRVRKHFSEQPGLGHHAERALGELENAEAYGDEGTAARARSELAALSYATPAERAEAAAERKAARERKAAEKDDDDDKGTERKDDDKQRREPPAGRTSTPASRQTTSSSKPTTSTAKKG